MMNAWTSKVMTIAAGLTALMTSLVNADYQGLQTQLHTSAVLGGQVRDVYRVYATFSNPGDFLTSVAGTPLLGNMHIQSLNTTGLFPGGDFYNPGGDPSLTGDTAPAIGQFDGIDFPPGFNPAGFIVGSEYIQGNGGWFTAGPVAQGMAGNGVLLPGGLWGVLTMQLTVNAGNHVRGTVALAGINDSGLAGGTGFQIGGQTFNSFPAPGSLGVLALAGLMSRRRRQR